ncbi:hypothetical protein HMPREF1549_00921 [Actinomyces johnsonii F0510]|uniref:Uncharacterized protein n=1 Tax=Actinomyces johnsonii F0510 TaxID=1227262 RepID=U1RMV1_9ACTO|nr:hypothetical protein HMPREF1549_00921 [Actinomyces johnsonii F0510]
MKSNAPFTSGAAPSSRPPWGHDVGPFTRPAEPPQSRAPAASSTTARPVPGSAIEAILTTGPPFLRIVLD